MKTHPPRFSAWLLDYFSRQGATVNYAGDFEEAFYAIVGESGLSKACRWYRSQVLRSLPNLIINALYWSFTMFINYLKTSFRNIKKHKSFSIINISGLSIGLACVLLLAIYINSELSYDSYHFKKDRIFRIGEHMSFNNFSGKQSATNGVIAAALKENYPEVEEIARFRYNRTSVKYKDKQFIERFYFADKSVFNIFSWSLLDGNQNTALEAPYSIVLSKELATKYFGSENPIGKMITLNETESFKVTAVMADLPRYSTLRFSGLCSFNTLYTNNNMPEHILTEWTSHNFNTYTLLKSGVNPSEFEEKIKNIYYDYAADKLKANGSSYSVFLQPIKDIYLRPLSGDFGPITYVYIFSIVAIFILLIACVNFMNLSTSRSMTRAREVGVRKVFGANRARLIKQFLTESLLITILAMGIAISIAFSLLPIISEFTQRDLLQDVFEMHWLVPGIVAATMFVGVLAGSYPALILSRFKPVQVINNKLNAPKANTNFRRTLVVLQFVISITLIISTVLVVQQLDYLKTKDIGFDKEHVVCLSVRDQLVRKSWPILQQKFKNLPEVINSGASSSLPGWGAPLNSKIPMGFTKDNTQLMREINIDQEFIPTMDIQIMAGRNFSKEYSNDARNTVIINEAAVRKFSWENPVGKTIQTINIDKLDAIEYEDREVIGVVKDFHLSGMTSEIQPAFIGNSLDYPFEYGKIHALATRIHPGDIQETVKKMETIWKETFNDKPFNYYFLDEDFNEQFISIERSRTILSYFTVLAIFIACLGLFGMVAYAAEKRTKEIGIRKTLGSSASQIVGLLSRELIFLILAANVIAYPIAYFAASQWLNNFPYHMDIPVSTFLISTLLALAISVLTISFQAWKAANANPVKSLRYE